MFVICDGHRNGYRHLQGIKVGEPMTGTANFVIGQIPVDLPCQTCVGGNANGDERISQVKAYQMLTVTIHEDPW